MGQYFTAGEFAKMHVFSKQTLIYYDRIGLLSPDMVDPSNGYRYYSSGQLEELDMIYILREAGLSLEEMKEFLRNRSLDRALALFREKSTELEKKIGEQKKVLERLKDMAGQLEKVSEVLNEGSLFSGEGGRKEIRVTYEEQKKAYLFEEKISPPFSMLDVDLAIKDLYQKAREKKVEFSYSPVTCVSPEHIASEKYTLLTEAATRISRKEYLRLKKAGENVSVIDEGLYAVFYHRGPYRTAGRSYSDAVARMLKDGWVPDSRSYEESVIDYLSASDEKDYITRIMIKVRRLFCG